MSDSRRAAGVVRSNKVRHGNRAARGFTLIELMIVVVVIAILAAIAYPNYQDQVRRARRGQAKADLVENAQLAERWHTVNDTYVGFGLIANQSPREAGSEARYTITAAPTANTFVLTAAPIGPQALDPCGTMTLSQSGQKTSAAALGTCW